MVRGETDKTAGDIQARSFTARLRTKLGRNAKLREKQKWAIEKPKLDNAGRLRGTYFIDPEDKELKETIRNARKNGKHHALQDVRPVARLMVSSLNLRVSWKPVNPQECVWKNLNQNIMRTILQEEVTTATLQFGSQIYSCASSNKDTRSKSSTG